MNDKVAQSTKIAVVTGAGRGIGQSVSVALAEIGFSVVLVGRTIRSLEETASLISKSTKSTSNEKSVIIRADVSDPTEVKSIFEQIKNKFGRLDLLFNNAGINLPREQNMEHITFDQWQQIIGINLTGSFLCAQEAIRLMKEQSPQGGRIINNGSISADRPRPNSAPYTATKHALTGLTKSIILDGRPYDITAGQINIGNAKTDLTAAMEQGVPQADGTVGMEPCMDVSEVGRAVAYMAGLPLSINVPFMTVMATKMPLFGRGLEKCLRASTTPRSNSTMNAKIY